MPDFDCVLRDTQGQLLQRRESADSRDDLASRLSRSGLTLLSCQERVHHDLRWPIRRAAPSFNLLLFCRELQILLQAGLAIMESLQILNDRQGDSGYQSVIPHILRRLEEGRSFSQALSELPEAFPRLFVAMMAASEQTGAIDEALARYIAYQESWKAVRGKLVSAAIYPLILIGVGSLVLGFMLFYLAPKFSLVYQQTGGEMRLSTQILVSWGHFVQEHRSLVLACVIILVGTIFSALRLPETRQQVMLKLLRVGPLKTLMHTVYCCQFYRSLALLLRGGSTALQAMDLSRQVLPPSYASSLDTAAAFIHQGGMLSEAFQHHGLTTDIAGRMLHSGENSGKLPHMLEQIAHFHEHEIMERIDRLTRLLEPLLMLIMGLVIGTLVISMYLPIFDMAGKM